MHDHAIQAHSGTYVLVLQSMVCRQIEIGRLGTMQVEAGYYLYVGSAFGPGGVKARVAHHMRIATRPRWHIDYLRQVCQLKAVWYGYDEVHREHEWVGVFESMSRVSVAMKGFGASDHPGQSHLFYCAVEPSFAAFARRVYKQQGEQSPPFITL